MGSAWKVAYADFVTAMMAFFLLMWVLNMEQETKAGIAEYFISGGTMTSTTGSPMANNPFINSTSKLDLRDVKISEAEQTHYALAQKLTQMLLAHATPQSATGISADDVGVQLRINNNAMFAPGSAELTPEGAAVLNDVLTVLKEYNLFLVVRGHADTQEIQGGIFNSPWELSAARAASTVGHFVDAGIKPTRLRAVAYADTRPLEPGNTPESQSKNRRVEFHFHRPEVMNFSIVY